MRLPPEDCAIPDVTVLHDPGQEPPNDFEASIDQTEQSYQDWRATSKHGAAPAEQFFRDIRHAPVKRVRSGMKKIQFG